jgi:chitinase
MASTEEGRNNFTESVVTFLKKFSFDGLDLDWEYPTQRGGTPEDKVNKRCDVKRIKFPAASKLS